MEVVRVTDLISRYLPESMTQVISGIVIPVSAMLVASSFRQSRGAMTVRSTGGTYHYLFHACWRNIEDSTLIVAREGGMQGVNLDIWLPKLWMITENIVQATDLGKTRHKNENSSGIATVRWIFKADFLQESYNEFVRDKTMIENVDGLGCIC